MLRRPDANRNSVVKTQLGTFLIRRVDTDLAVLRQVFVNREYDLDRTAQGKRVRSAYEHILRRGKVPLIIDADANAGFATCFFANTYPKHRFWRWSPTHSMPRSAARTPAPYHRSRSSKQRLDQAGDT